jgi:dihydrofolate reductase
MNNAPITIIVARAENGVIGRDGTLPWHIPADLKRFKALTMGHPMILGRRTYDSVGFPLPGRPTIVITRQAGWSAPGVIVTHTLDEALERARELDGDEIFIGGGEEIFRLALDRADRIYLTRIDQDFPGDTFFPEFDASAWRIVEREDHPATEARPYAFSFLTYEK